MFDAKFSYKEAYIETMDTYSPIFQNIKKYGHIFGDVTDITQRLLWRERNIKYQRCYHL